MDNESKDNRMSLIRFFQNQSRRHPNMVDFNLIRSINSFEPPPQFARLFQYQFAGLNDEPIRGFDFFYPGPYGFWYDDAIHGKFRPEWLYDYLVNIFRPERPDELIRVFKNLRDLSTGIIRKEFFINEYDPFYRTNFTSIYLYPQVLTEEWKQNLIILEQLLLDLLEKYPDYTIGCMRDALEDWLEYIQLDDLPENLRLEITNTTELVMSTKELIFGYALYLVKKLFEKCIDSIEELKLLIQDFSLSRNQR